MGDRGAARCLTGLVALLAVLVAACAPQGAPATSGQAAPPKRLIAATRGDPKTTIAKLTAAGSSQLLGTGDIQDLVAAGLTNPDGNDNLRPQLAEAVATVENGLWKLLQDGRMETTWHLRDGVKWHDGTPITVDDLRFTARIGTENDVPIFTQAGYKYVESVEAPDPTTVIVTWKQPFIEADQMFTSNFALPLPQHLLEQGYDQSHSNFAQLPYWSEEFVGSGPYRVKEWAYDNHVLLEANADYVLARPKIDTIEIRFITDSNALIANVLSGDVELTLGRAISLEQATATRDQWHVGHVDWRISGGLVIYPQFMNPSPEVVRATPFRQALLLAIDRQRLVGEFMSGQSKVAHTFLSPDYPGYADIDPLIVKYPYDPSRASQLIDGLGFTRGPDGAYRDPGGQKLALELRVTEGDDLNSKAALTIADAWQKAGIDATASVIPTQRASDREYAATFPGLFLNRQKSDLSNMNNFHSSQTPTTENKFTGTNRSRYVSPELDALIDRYFVSIPKTERMQIVGQILHQMTDQLSLMTLFYSEDASLIADRLQNVSARGSSVVWNASEWDIQG